MSDCKPCQLVECVPANDFSYSLAVPPAPPPPPGPPFGNDQLQFCCPDAETLNITGDLPGWAFVSGNCIGVKPNTFRAFDKAVANGEAQALLNSFVATSVTCGTPTFTNALATYYKTCTGGVYQGQSVCETVNAGVFTSAVSHLDADTMARYAAYIAMIPSPPGPCCSSPSVLAQGGWADVGSSPNGVNVNGVTATWSWDQANATLTFDLEVVPDAGRPDTNAMPLIVMRWDFCNPWPVYNISAHLDYSFDITNINGTGVGAALTIGYALVSLVATPTFDYPAGGGTLIGAGSHDWTPFGVLSGADAIQFVVDLGNSTTSHAASGSFRGTLRFTPLIPPTYTAPTCTVMATVPVPFNYALRPANDDFDNAIVVAGAAGNLTFDNTYASMEPGEPLTIAGWESDCTGWYAWVAPFSGTVTFDPAGSTLADDPAIAVYTGSLLTNLVSIVEKNQTAPPFTWAAVGGTLYYWRIGGFFADVGVTHLAWTLV